MATTFTFIASATVTGATASSMDFNSIPNTYDDLYIVHSLRSNRSYVTDVTVLFCNNSNSNFKDKRFEFYQSGSKGATTDNFFFAHQATGASSTSNTFGSGEIYILNYKTSNAYKAIYARGVSEIMGADNWQGFTGGFWNDTAAISSIQIKPDAGTAFVTNSTAYLYGIKNS